MRCDGTSHGAWSMEFGEFGTHTHMYIYIYIYIYIHEHVININMHPNEDARSSVDLL